MPGEGELGATNTFAATKGTVKVRKVPKKMKHCYILKWQCTFIQAIDFYKLPLKNSNEQILGQLILINCH